MAKISQIAIFDAQGVVGLRLTNLLDSGQASNFSSARENFRIERLTANDPGDSAQLFDVAKTYEAYRKGFFLCTAECALTAF